MTLEYILRSKNIEFGENDPSKDVNIRTDVSFDAMSGVFVAGESDYVTAFEPVASQVERMNKGYIVASLGEDSGEIPYTSFSCLKSFMEGNEDTLKRFTKAIQKGLDFVLNEDIDSIVKYLKSDFTTSDEEELTQVMKNYLKIMAWPTTPTFVKANFEKLITIIKEAGELDEDAAIPYETLVTNRYI